MLLKMLLWLREPILAVTAVSVVVVVVVVVAAVVVNQCAVSHISI